MLLVLDSTRHDQSSITIVIDIYSCTENFKRYIIHYMKGPKTKRGISHDFVKLAFSVTEALKSTHIDKFIRYHDYVVI